MITFPAEVLDFLYHNQLDQRKPAWFLVSTAGEIIERGGFLDHFGFSSGSGSVEDEFPWLIGFLPHRGDRLEMSLVEVDDRTAFQPYLLPYGEDETIVVVFDVSRDLIFQRAAQQIVNEGTLLQHSRERDLPRFLVSLPAELDLLILEHRRRGDFLAYGKSPTWWPLARTCSLAGLIQYFPMIEIFLDEAEGVWSGDSASATSEVWETDQGQALYASAHLVDGTELLVVRSTGPVYEDLRHLMQDLHGAG